MNPKDADIEFTAVNERLCDARERLEHFMEAKLKEVEENLERPSNTNGARRKGRGTLHERFFGR